MRIPVFLTTVTAVVLAVGCASDSRHEADRGLEGTLRAELNQKHVHVDVHKGIVTLDGHVRTEADRDRIETTVRNTPGVVAVKDNLKVTFPTPGTFGANPVAAPPTAVVVPQVITAPPPTAVVTLPPPLVMPQYPRLKVQASTIADQPTADRIAAELRTAPVRPDEIEDVTITVKNGTAALRGAVDSSDERRALNAAVEKAGGVLEIYDQLRVK